MKGHNFILICYEYNDDSCFTEKPINVINSLQKITGNEVYEHGQSAFIVYTSLSINEMHLVMANDLVEHRASNCLMQYLNKKSSRIFDAGTDEIYEQWKVRCYKNTHGNG